MDQVTHVGTKGNVRNIIIVPSNLAQWFYRIRKCKSLHTDKQTNDRQWMISKSYLSFQHRCAKNNCLPWKWEHIKKQILTSK
jgi:hypothetical protein